MKYTIEGFQQEKLIELNCDCTDAIILRYIVDFNNTGKMKKVIIGEKNYFWIYYKALLEELPILKIKKQALADRFKKMCQNNILEFYLEKNVQGTFTYYKFIEKTLEELLTSTSQVVQNNPVSSETNNPVSNEQPAPLRSELPYKDSSTILNSSTNDNSTKDNNIYTQKIKILLNIWNECKVIEHKYENVYKQIFNKNGKIFDKYKKILDENEIDYYIKSIKNYNEVIKNSNKYYFNYKWSFWDFLIRGSQKFSDEYTPLENFKIKNNYDGRPKLFNSRNAFIESLPTNMLNELAEEWENSDFRKELFGLNNKKLSMEDKKKW